MHSASVPASPVQPVDGDPLTSSSLGLPYPDDRNFRGDAPVANRFFYRDFFAFGREVSYGIWWRPERRARISNSFFRQSSTYRLRSETSIANHGDHSWVKIATLRRYFGDISSR